MASNEQIPVNQTTAAIEAAEADVMAKAAAEAKQAADAETEQEQAEKKRAELESMLNTGDALVNILETHMAKPTLQTPVGFSVLDKALGDGLDDGGLPPGLITLGAIPSLGKTAFVLQMADYMAEHGRDVLMIALEMSPLELTARSVSRLTAEALAKIHGIEALEKDYPHALSAKGVRLYNARREMYPPQNQAEVEYRREMDERLKAAITRYREQIAPHVFFHSPKSLIPASGVKNLVERFADVHGNAPIVILDYIQILAAEQGKERNTEKQNMDAAALTLKHLSRDYKTPVLCVSSFNRMNYNEPVSMESFKESGGIEYSSDAVIGMQLYGTGFYNPKKGKTLDVDYEKSRTPRRIQARILKNRDGITGRFINLEYYPAVNLFQEVSTQPEKKFRDAPAHWKADPPMWREATEEELNPAVPDITALMKVPKKPREHKVTSKGK